jgi:hypothetical protein
VRSSKIRRLLLVAVAISAVFVLPQAALAGSSNPSPQAPLIGKAAVAAAAVADQCILMKQMNADEQKYRLTYNAPTTYTVGAYGTGYFDLMCGKLTFTVPRGSDSMVDFTAAAELDCQAPNDVTTSSPTNAWCESRFQVNVINVLPNNNGRGDTFAWDSSNGGTFDWQANTLDQVGHVVCPRSDTTQSPCTYDVRLQARLDNGATSLWVDDLTIRIDVSEGPVTVTSVKP